MDQVFTFTDAQLLNFMHLHAIRSNLNTDPVATAFKYHLSRTQIEYIAGLQPKHMQALIANLRQVSLFVPRANLIQLLESPVALAPVLAAALSVDRGEPVDLPERRQQPIHTVSERVA